MFNRIFTYCLKDKAIIFIGVSQFKMKGIVACLLKWVYAEVINPFRLKSSLHQEYPEVIKIQIQEVFAISYVLIDIILLIR